MTTILTTTGLSLYFNTRNKVTSHPPTDEQMLQYLKENPVGACAETNSLLQIIHPDDYLVFLHTETPEATRCANLLKDYFIKERGFKPFQVKVRQLRFSTDEKDLETQGLRNLVNTLIDEVETAQRNKRDVVINATAGLKAQVVYSTMIGMIYNVPVKYIYEEFRRVVTFNPIALDWDTNLFLTYDGFFEWIDEEPRSQKDVEQRLKALPDSEKIRALLSNADGNVYLSDMGNVLRRRFAQQTQEAEDAPWPASVEGISVDDKIAYALLQSKHHPIKNILQFARKVAELAYVQEITGGFFENTSLSRVKRSEPDGIIYLLWADDSKAQNLIVRTTAKGNPQTLKVTNLIKQIMKDM